MDILKIIDIARQLQLPELVQAAASLVSDLRAGVIRAGHVLTDADRAELDAIHEAALAAADRLDADLAAAEQR